MNEKRKCRVETFWTTEEKKVIEKMSKKKELSEQALLRQALRTMQLIENWMAEGATVKFDQAGMHRMDNHLSKQNLSQTITE